MKTLSELQHPDPPRPPVTPLLLDGATATNLFAAGMPRDLIRRNSCNEEWILDHPQTLQTLQKSYLDAGADVLYAPTFTASRPWLAGAGLDGQLASLNLRLVQLTREVAGDRAKVAGNLSPTGLVNELTYSPRMVPELDFHELIDIYAEQAFALREGGADLIVAETMLSLTEARAALLGARQTGLPVYITFTVDEKGQTLSHGDPLSALIVLQRLGAAGFGVNCSAGFAPLEPLFRRLAPHARIPLIAKPGAGLSSDALLSPEDFAGQMARLLSAGVSIAGGCCGTTPAHIAALRKQMDSFDFSSFSLSASYGKETEDPVPAGEGETLILADEDDIFYLEPEYELSPPLDCSVDMADRLLEMEDGYDVISIHASCVEDAPLLGCNAHMLKNPISICSDSPEAMEEALIHYPGVAILDRSSDITPEEIEALAKGYGAFF